MNMRALHETYEGMDSWTPTLCRAHCISRRRGHSVCRVPASWLQDRGTTGLNQYANRWDAPMERSFAENAALTAALVRDRPIYLYPVYTTASSHTIPCDCEEGP